LHEAGADAGLLLGRKLLEAGLALEGLLLLLRGEVLVLLHPLAEVAGGAGALAIRGLAVAIHRRAGAEGGRVVAGVELLRVLRAADDWRVAGLRVLRLRVVVRRRSLRLV
jgi:hypothetical protein